MEKGDKVKITDGFYAHRLGDYAPYDGIGTCRDVFEIIEKEYHIPGYTQSGKALHDIIIKNTVNGKIYLHSSSMVTQVKPTELTVADIEERLGYSVKIIK